MKRLKIIKLAKEKGFIESEDTTIMKFLIQLIHDWMRDEHNIIVIPTFDKNSFKYQVEIYYPPKNGWSLRNDSHIFKMHQHSYNDFDDALENGILEALKLIKE